LIREIASRRPGQAEHKNPKSIIIMAKYDDKNKARNPDPITKAPGSHPIGTGVGAAAGAATAGAAVGSFAGPVGTLAGAAVGAVVGGLAGKGVAEKINPTVEDAYWRENHSRQPYAKGSTYNDYAPAYRTGYEGYREYGILGKSYDESEAELRRRYESSKPKIAWENAKVASRAAWDRTHVTYGAGARPQDTRRPA
jgi:hypothetical protein